VSFNLRYAVILAFDVKIEREAQELADSLGVRVFSAEIIYHLFDKFTAYREVCSVNLNYSTCLYSGKKVII
jgi:translation initiation factor IF-2